MERLGPEALLVSYARTRASALGEFARLEYHRSEAPRMEALLMWESSGYSEHRSAVQRIREWGRGLVRRAVRDSPRRASDSAGAPLAAGIVGSPGPRLELALGSLPATLSSGRRSKGTFPLAAAPGSGRS